MEFTLLSIAFIVGLCTSWSSAFIVPDASVVTPPTQDKAPSFDSSGFSQTVQHQKQQQFMEERSSSPLQNGIREYMTVTSSSSSSMTLSLKERPPPPTPEELA